MPDARAVARACGSVAGCAAFLVAIATGVASADESPLPATIDRVRPSIVAVGTNEPTRNPSFLFRGTGFAIGDGNYIATNAHVLPGSTDDKRLEKVSVAVPTGNGEAALRDATVVAQDVEHDVAILRIAGPALAALRFGDSKAVREGLSIAFTGFPIGNVIGLFPTTHRGTVSAITPAVLTPASARSLDPAMIKRLRAERFAIFQLDATAYPGNSGSPVYDIDSGEVLAVINSGLVKAGKESALSQPSGISYAIPAIHFERALKAAMDGR